MIRTAKRKILLSRNRASVTVEAGQAFDFTDAEVASLDTQGALLPADAPAPVAVYRDAPTPDDE